MYESKPLVSIGLPVYNGERFIRQTLDSLLAQDYEHFELIISDNASTDHTAEICQEYVAKDQRVRYHRNTTNLGAVKNFNRVFALAQGTYFMWAADHDHHAPTFISRCIAVLEQDSSVVLCYPQTVRIEPDGSYSEPIPPRLDTRGMFDISRFQSVIWSLTYCYQIYGLIRSSALRRTGLSRSTLGPDTILLAELALLGTFAYVPEQLLYIRRMPDSGDWAQYVRKLGRRPTRWSALLLYGQLIYYHLLVVHQHMRSLPRKVLLLLAVLLCIPIRYRGVLRDMISAVRAQRRPH